MVAWAHSILSAGRLPNLHHPMAIGEFSQATRLSANTLRFYHQVGLLAPARVEHPMGIAFGTRSRLMMPGTSVIFVR